MRALGLQKQNAVSNGTACALSLGSVGCVPPVSFLVTVLSLCPHL